MELFRALGALAEPPSAALSRVAEAAGLGPLPDQAAHTEIFVLQLQPYASIYLGAEGMLGGEALDRIAGFWRALDLTPPAEPDHLTTLLAFYAGLAERESEASGTPAADAARTARRACFWEHMASWLPAYLTAMADRAGGFYAQWASLLRRALAEEADRVGSQGRLSLHLREALPVADPRLEGSGAFVASVLTPVRSGLVLARADLAGAADALGVSLRLGDRRMVLTGLIAEDAPAALEWISRRAEWWADRHDADGAFGDAALFWAERARRTAALARVLAADARGT